MSNAAALILSAVKFERQLKFDFESLETKATPPPPTAEPTGPALPAYEAPLSGTAISKLMRQHRVTIKELSTRMGITMKRIREVRNSELPCPLAARDWIEAITGSDPGAVPNSKTASQLSSESATATPVAPSSLLLSEAAMPQAKNFLTSPAATMKENATDNTEATQTLVRPERQIAFGDTPHYEWPDPRALHDRDTITVDRIRNDIDGTAHRFIIKRDDSVEVYFSAERLELGTVTGISHARNEVRVAFSPDSKGIWVDTSCVYPALETPITKKTGTPLSLVIDDANDRFGEGLTDEHRVPTSEPYTLNDFSTYYERFDAGEIKTAREHQVEFERMLSGKQSFIAHLETSKNAKQLKALAGRLGIWDANRNTKGENAAACFNSLICSFALEATVSHQPLSGETIEDAVRKIVAELSDEQLTQHLAAKKATEDKFEKALTNPETLLEFRTFASRLGTDALSDEQLERFDDLEATQSRLRRLEERATVSQIDSGDLEDLALTITEGFHTKKQIPLFIVSLSRHVDRRTWKEFDRKAKMLGGWYSSFVKDQTGFQFKELERAERFVTILDGDVDRTDVLGDRKTRKEETAGERLSRIADEMTAAAEAELVADADKLKNTVRRAEHAASARERARAAKAFATTARSIARALGKGEATHLSGIRHMTHIKLLTEILHRAKRSHLRATNEEPSDDSRLPNKSDVRFAELPYPSLYKRHLEELIAAGLSTKGAKQAARKMAKRIKRADEYVTFKSPGDVELLEDFLSRVDTSGNYWTEHALDDYKRLLTANVHTLQELRAALRELTAHLSEKATDDPLTKALDELRGKRIEGFFPTPKRVAMRMAQLLQVMPGNTILEPSCGIGSLIDVLLEVHPDALVSSKERNHIFASVLSAKGYDTEFCDFLEHDGHYDRILMNPPFERGQDIDHVRHAYQLLASSGRLVAIMSEGPFFRQDAKATAFRSWLQELGGSSERLPENAFMGSDAFRETGVSTRIVTIEKR